MHTKRAAAEQLRKYATVARFIREQRMMQKRAEKPGKTVPKPSFGSNHKHVYDHSGTIGNQKTNYELKQQGKVPQLRGWQADAHAAHQRALNGWQWTDPRTWIPYWRAEQMPAEQYYLNYVEGK